MKSLERANGILVGAVALTLRKFKAVYNSL